MEDSFINSFKGLKFKTPPRRGGWVWFLFLISHISYLVSPCSAQSSTRSQSGNDLTVEENKKIAAQHKVMVIPFEPKMFMSEISKNINKETNMSFDQIRNTFRSGLEFDLLMDVKSTFRTVSLLADSANTRKDVDYIYGSIGYSYDVIPVENPTKADIKKNEEKNAKKQGIKNGEVVVKINEDHRFMNAKISNRELLSYLNKKYETDIFIFVNQLDIKNSVAEGFDINSNGFEREVTIHYTIFDLTGKQLNAGTTTSRFSSQVNDPKKIIMDHVSVATRGISKRLVNNLMPPKPEEKKESPSKTKVSDKVK